MTLVNRSAVATIHDEIAFHFLRVCPLATTGWIATIIYIYI